MKRSDSLQELVNGFKQGLARKTDELASAGKLGDAHSAIAELEHKLKLAELVQQFYNDLPDTKKMMINAALPAELKELLQKKGP